MARLKITLSNEKIIQLGRSFSSEDIRVAFFDLSLNKSMGLDGFHLVFFQQC